MRQNCPVCFEYLFDSVRPTAVLPCGHTIHSDCLREMEHNRSGSDPTALAPIFGSVSWVRLAMRVCFKSQILHV